MINFYTISLKFIFYYRKIDNSLIYNEKICEWDYPTLTIMTVLTTAFGNKPAKCLFILTHVLQKTIIMTAI